MKSNNALKLDDNSDRPLLLACDVQREIDLCKAKITERARKNYYTNMN